MPLYITGVNRNDKSEGKSDDVPLNELVFSALFGDIVDANPELDAAFHVDFGTLSMFGERFRCMDEVISSWVLTKDEGVKAAACTKVNQIYGGADILTSTTSLLDAIAHYAAHYGRDVADPEEAQFAVGLLSLGAVARDSQARQVVLAEVHTVSLLLARGATWAELSKHASVKPGFRS